MKEILIISVITTVLLLCCLSACTRHEVNVAPVEVKPIHITIDVNVKVDRELDSFFDDIDSAEQQDAASSPSDGSKGR
jgi:hypothetical protein